MSRLPDPDMQPEFYDGVVVKRLLAWIVDTVLLTALALLMVPFTAFTAIFYFPFLWFVVGFVYRVITIANGSATLGMRLMSIELRTQDDKPLDLGQAFLHTAGFSFSFGTFLIQIVSMVLMATSARCQGLTDMVLGTAMLNKRRR